MTARTTYYRGYVIDMIDLADWRIYWGNCYLASKSSLQLAKHYCDCCESDKNEIMDIPLVSNGTHAI